MATVKPSCTGLSSVAENVKSVVVPPVPSGCDAVTPLRVNVAVSSLRTAPVAGVPAVLRSPESTPVARPETAPSATLNNSSASTFASWFTCTVIEWLSSAVPAKLKLASLSR